MILPILTGTDNEILRTVAKPVAKITKAHLKLIKNLKETMAHANGLGLAAPQVGVSERILIANFQYGRRVGEKQAAIALINAEIISHAEELELGEEGCLSLPDFYASVSRYKWITVRFLNEKGKSELLELSDLNARIVQHEIDHLDGKLFVDYLDASTLGKVEEELAKANQSHESAMVI